MAFTYTGPNTAAEKVRYHIQDTDSSRPLLTDAEITYELDQAGGDVLVAALGCARTLVARGSHKVTKKIGDLQIDYSDLTSQYQSLVAALEERICGADMVSAVPDAGEKTADSEYPTALEHTDLAGPYDDD